MINWMYFPQNRQIEPHLSLIVDAFVKMQEQIDSEGSPNVRNLNSNDVLAIVAPELDVIGYSVEKSKRTVDKIRVPSLFGKNGTVNLAFEVDGYSHQAKTVIEVEAGRAVDNYQFLKDFFEACMMNDVDYLCIAVKNIYGKTHDQDFNKVCDFFSALYASNRLQIPLSGILIVGY